ncbi:butyrophilin subfamily 1 member A1-like [Carcharodon carcharias]|uniref:butyrophilin subfamily 1 member A1-like n=1 Tax=Carcharodon carcharias TaxID=13397 RepID=UPI001B7EEBFE|nr:butyrophilin subfamily 1 member A1-like [Carcharodon carcharias]
MKGRCFSIVFLLAFHSVLSERFHVLVPEEPTIVVVGEDVVLECQLVPDISLDNLEIRWFKLDSVSPVHLYTDGQDRPDVQNKAYQGRTELFKDEFFHGNASLKLKKIKTSDEGSYTCFVDSKTYRNQAVINLKVEADWMRRLPHITRQARQEVTEVVTFHDDVQHTRTHCCKHFNDLLHSGRAKTESNMREQQRTGGGHAELQRLITNEEQAMELGRRQAARTAGVGEAGVQRPGFGHRPWVYLEENKKKGLRVVCKSDGWYPEPEIWWEDGNGQDVTTQSEWEFLKDSKGLITVQSHIDITSDSVNKFSCFMGNRLLNKRREAHVQISDEFFPKVNVINAWLITFWVVAGLVVTAIAADVILHRKEDKMIQELQLFCTLEGYDEVEVDYVSVNLDVETASPWLEVSEDLKSLRWTRTRRSLPDTGKRFTVWSCALGSEGFTSGRHYWEVEVEGNRRWRLGVAAESVERKDRVSLSPETGFWIIERFGDEFYIKSSPESRLPVGQIPGKVGVYLSFESGTVSFYSADTKSHLHSFTGNKFTEKLYPFFWTWNENQFLRICSGSDWISERGGASGVASS